MTTRLLSRVAAGAAALVLASAGALAAAAPAAADPTAGNPAAASWGAGGYRFLAGRACASGSGAQQVTTPLAAWNLGAGRAPAFLVGSVISSGGVDSAVPPLPDLGAQTVSPVAPKQDGFRSASDIADYASLLTRYGSGGNSEAAQVARAVIEKVTGSATACASVPDPAPLLAEADRTAGPYTLAFDHQPGDAVMGQAGRVTVTVTGASGAPVPDVPVHFAAPGGVLFATVATTDSHGHASVGFQIAPGTTAASVPVTAQATVSVGLEQVQVQAKPTATDPTGASVAAIVATPPQTDSARQQLTVDPSAKPHLAVSSDHSGIAAGGSITPFAAVSGMNGHSGILGVQITGPLPLTDGTLCSALSAADFANAPVAATSTRDVVGDQQVSGPDVTLRDPGCYRLVATLHTTDATPQAAATAAAAEPITVLDTAAVLHVTEPLVRSGALAGGALDITHLYGARASVHAALRGPVAIPYGHSTCATADFSHAGYSGGVNTSPGGSDVPDEESFSAATSGVGCYEIGGTVTVTVAPGAQVRVPISDGATVMAIDPAVTLAMNQIAALDSASVSAQVTPIGTQGLPAHVAIKMMRGTSSPLGCRYGDYSHAVLASTGPSTTLHGDLAAVTVQSAAFHGTGCYAPVAVLTMDQNPKTTATTAFDRGSVVNVGVSADRPVSVVNEKLPAEPSGHLTGAGIGFGAALLLALGFGAAAVRRDQRGEWS